MYTCVCAGLVVIDSLRTALGSLKEEDEDDLDLRRRTSDFGDFNGLLGSAYAQEKRLDS